MNINNNDIKAAASANPVPQRSLIAQHVLVVLLFIEQCYWLSSFMGNGRCRDFDMEELVDTAAW